MSYPAQGMRFEHSGEDRAPRRGEWYWGLVGPALAERDFHMRRLPILRRLDDGPRCPEELERERLDAEAKENAGVVQSQDTGLPGPESRCESGLPLSTPTTATRKLNDLRPIGEAAPAVRREYLPYTDSDSEEL